MDATTYQVKRGADVGSLQLDADHLCFTPKNGEKETTTIPWDQVAKHQSNPAKNAKALIKIVPQDAAASAVTFQLKNRTILDNLQQDISNRMESYGKKGDGEVATGSSGTETVYSHVGFQSTTGSATLTDQGLVYRPDYAGKTVKISWSKVAKYQASPPKIQKSLLKLVLGTGKNHTFQLADRTELKLFQEDVARRIKKLGSTTNIEEDKEAGEEPDEEAVNEPQTEQSEEPKAEPQPENVEDESQPDPGISEKPKDGQSESEAEPQPEIIDDPIDEPEPEQHPDEPEPEESEEPKAEPQPENADESMDESQPDPEIAEKPKEGGSESEAEQQQEIIEDPIDEPEPEEPEDQPEPEQSEEPKAEPQPENADESMDESQPDSEAEQQPEIIEDPIDEPEPEEPEDEPEPEESEEPIDERNESEDSEDDAEGEEQSKGQASKEHSPVQAASQSPSEEAFAVENEEDNNEKSGDSSDEETAPGNNGKEIVAFSGTLNSLIDMGKVEGEGHDGSQSSSEHSEEEAVDVWVEESVDQSAEVETEAGDEDLFEEDRSDEPEVEVNAPQNEESETEELPDTSMDENDLVEEVECAMEEVPGSSSGDMDDSIDSMAEHDDINSQGSHDSLDEPMEAVENPIGDQDAGMNYEGATYAEASADYEEEEEGEQQEVYPDKEGESEHETGEGSFEEEQMIKVETANASQGDMSVEIDTLMDRSSSSSAGSSIEDFEITEEIAPASQEGYLAPPEDTYPPSSQLDMALDVDSGEILEEEEEEHLSSLLGGGNTLGREDDLEEEEEDIEDYDVLAGKPIRAEGEYSDEEDYLEDEPKIRIRRRDEYDSDDEPVAAGSSDDEETPFFDDDNEDSSVGGFVGESPFTMLARGDVSVADSQSSEETLSLSGLTGVHSLSSNVSATSSEDYGSEEEDGSRSQPGSESGSGSISEEDEIYSHEEEEADDYSASDSSDTASFADDSEYSNSDSDDDSSRGSGSGSEDYSDEEEDSEEEETPDYQDPASAWLNFAETKSDEVFPEQLVPVLKKKNKKKKGRRDSGSEGSEEYYSDEEYGEGEYSDEDKDDYSQGSSGSEDDTERSMELELDIEDLSVDDLEGALVSKLQAEIGDSADAQQAVHQMLSSLRDDLLHGKETSGKSKRGRPGMPEDFYDWAKQTAAKVLDKNAQKLEASPPDNEAAQISSGSVLDKELFFDWKKFAKESKKEKSSEEPPLPTKETAPAEGGQVEPAPTEGGTDAPAEPAAEEAKTKPAAVDTALPPNPYDDAMVEQWTLRPKEDDQEIKLFNWKGFTNAKRPKTGPAATGAPKGPPSFDWKKRAKYQRKIAKKAAKAEAKAKKGEPADEEKKSDEEQKPSPGEDVTNGVDLLKQLISAEDESGQSALLNKYLAPPESPVVPPDDLLQSIAKFVDMVRTVKKSDNAPEITSARQVAIVARLAILEHYGEGSEALTNFEQGLAPAFAPKYDTEGS